jgi:peroxiredoxin/outer membrane lipoprotein-sorting protein
MPRLSSVCAFLAVLASAQAPKPELVKILKDVSTKAQAAKEYAFEGKIELAGQHGTDPGKILSQAKVRLAIGSGGKYLVDLDAGDKGAYQLISNGQKSWAFVPKMKQYMEEEAGAAEGDDSETESDSERDEAEVWSRLVVPILARLYPEAAKVGPGGEAELVIGKKKVKGPIVRIAAKPGKKGEVVVTDLVLEPETLNLGRLVQTTVTNEGGVKNILRLTVDFTSLQLTEPPPESTFVFVAPKNAKLVESLPIPGQTGSFLLNHAAPDFDLKTLDGQRTKLSDLRGHPVLLDFWATWCGPCRRELPSIAKLATEYKERGLVVLGVNDEGKGKARDFAAKNGLGFANLDDGDQKMYKSYRVHLIPSVFLIDADGKVVRFFRGAHEYEALKASLKSVGL